jgi:Fe-S cluster assembly iron-binding protein IscA
LGLTLEESVEDEDEVFEFNGITFIIERSLRENLGEVTVDFAPDTGMVVKGTGK